MSTAKTSAQARLLEAIKGVSVPSNLTEIYGKLSDDDLLMAEDDWYEREEHTDVSAWWNIGVALYSELFRRSPNDGRYSAQLSDLLLKTATDAKVHYRQYDVAKRLLIEVLHLEYKNALAHYRLGFVYYELKDYHRAIKHLENACQIRSRFPDLAARQSI